MGCKLSEEEDVVIGEARKLSLGANQNNTQSLNRVAFPLTDMGQLVTNLVKMAPASPMIHASDSLTQGILPPSTP